jgi:hypothetical protein
VTDRHDYLGMVLDFSQKGTVIVDMSDYVAEMIEESLLVLGPKDADLRTGTQQEPRDIL